MAQLRRSAGGAAAARRSAADRVADTILRRARLEDRLADVLDRRLTTVVAEAGFGKSTLTASWAERVASVWLTLTPDTGTLGTLARLVVDGLAAHRVPLPKDVLAAATAQRGPGVDEDVRADAVSASICEALRASVADPFLLIFDDLHELNDRGSAIRLVEGLVRHAPPTVHVVLVSRHEIPFPIERLRGRGQVLTIDAPMLGFTVDEVAHQLGSRNDPDAVPLATAVHELTGGWPAAVRLAIEVLREIPRDQRTSALESLATPGGRLFAYLAEEVIAREPREVRELIEVIALLPRFDAGLCVSLGLEDAPAILADLRARGLFVRPGGDGWFTLHELLRRFVLHRMPLPAEAQREIHRRAARALEDRGLFQEALEELGLAGDSGALRDVLERRGGAVLASGAVAAVVRSAELVPAETRGRTVDALLGEAYMVAGDGARALASFERSAAPGDRLTPGLAWRMGVLRYLRGEHEDALQTLASARPDSTQPRDSALLLAWTATVHWLRGDFDACRAEIAEARIHAEASNDDGARAAVETVLAMIASVDGQPHAMEEHSATALAAAERAGDTLQAIRIRNNRASHLADTGRFDEALADLEEALRMAAVTGFGFFEAIALTNRAQIWIAFGQVELARMDFEASLAIYRRLGSRSEAYALLGIGEVDRLRGELVPARAAFEAALEIAERNRDTQIIGPALVRLASVLMTDDPARARSLAERAVATSPPPLLVDSLVGAGWVALADDDRAQAEALASRASTEAARRMDLRGLAEAEELLALSAGEAGQMLHHLDEARSMWVRAGSVLGRIRVEVAIGRLGRTPEAQATAEQAERELANLGVKLPAAAAAAGFFAAIPRAPADALWVQTLGGLSVVRDGEQVALAEWQSRKARDLLKILLARRGRPIAREELIELLWPDEDSDKLGARLSVQLAILRAVLDPARRTPDGYLESDGASVRIDVDALPIDLERFMREASDGLRALRRGDTADAQARLTSAEARYTGDFLEDDAYADWAVSTREEARHTYVAVARALAGIAARAGDVDMAIRYSLGLLRLDPYDEESQLQLVSTLSRGGRHGEARRLYGTYVSRMRELEVEPAPFPSMTKQVDAIATQSLP